jgi:outer membrane protein insertion porin family
MRVKFLILFLIFFSNTYLSQEESWVLEDIRVSGLQRVSAGSVFAVMPVSIGDIITEDLYKEIVVSIFDTGKFDDIKLGRDGNALLINLQERPTIDEILIEGNKAIKTDALLDGLKNSGIFVGALYKRSVFESLSIELERQYSSQGKYSSKVEVLTEDLPKNRVKLSVNIDEGASSSLVKINIVGNKTFTDEEILEQFKLKEKNWLSIFGGGTQYSKENLRGDLESIESLYKNQGYLKFEVLSSIVSISQNKEDIFLTITIDEGDIYKVTDVKLAGDLDTGEEIISTLITIPTNEIYIDGLVKLSEDRIKSFLESLGYTNAEVASSKEVNDEEKTVQITLFVDKGQRTMVNRIVFQGNERTHDIVLRREMRQMEKSWASNNLIETSKLRLNRLGFFKNVDYEKEAVPGSPDEIDIIFKVEEQYSGSIGGSLGYGAYGLNLGANYSEKNAFGTGNSVSVGINYSKWRQDISFDFFNPYFTIEGIGLGYGAYFRKTDYGSFNIAAYNTDSFGGSVRFQLPISEIESVGLSISADNTDLATNIYSSRQLQDFYNSEGSSFATYSTQLSWSRFTLDRGVFPTNGSSNSISLSLTLPGSNLNYGRFSHNLKLFRPLTRGLIFGYRSNIGYLFAYGDTQTAPPYQNFYAGGMRSVRGFKQNYLGPKAVYDNGFTPNYQRPIGGPYSISGGFDLIVPLNFLPDPRSIRASIFLDYGNVFSEECKSYEINCYEFDLSELRYSIGLGFTWITALGPLSFALASVFNDTPDDRIENFQFEIGTQF